MLASNVAQGGAALAVALRTKKQDVKAMATSAGITLYAELQNRPSTALL